MDDQRRPEDRGDGQDADTGGERLRYGADPRCWLDLADSCQDVDGG